MQTLLRRHVVLLELRPSLFVITVFAIISITLTASEVVSELASIPQ